MQRSIVNNKYRLLLIFALSGCAWVMGCNDEEVIVPVEMNKQVNKPQLAYLSGSMRCLSFNESFDGKVTQHSCVSDDNHTVELSEVAEKLYNIKIPAKNLCLEVPNASFEEGAKTQFAPCNGGENQKIIFQTSRVDFLFKKIIFAHSKKCLGTTSLQRSNDVALTQNDCKDVTWQDFLFTNPRTNKKTIPRTIWSFWDKGAAAMPAFYRANIKRWEEVLNRDLRGREKWRIEVINLNPDDANYYGNFIDPASIPDVDFIASRIGTASFEKKLKPAVVFSDFLRLQLLHTYGGVWLDPSIILHSNLDNIINVMEVLENFNLGAFTSRSQGTYPLRYADSFENFFIVSFPDVDLMKTWKRDFRLYWELKRPDMRIQDNPLYNGSLGFKLDVTSFGHLADYLNEHIAFKYTLLTRPGSLDEVLIFGDASAAEKGPFTLLTAVYWDDTRLLKLTRREIDSTISELSDVLLSKFPSDNSKSVRQETDINYFFRDDNILGRLNLAELYDPLQAFL